MNVHANHTELVENFTVSNEIFFSKQTWKICFPCIILLLAAGTWMAISFLVYACNYRKKQKNEQGKYSAGKVMISAVSSTFLILPRLAFTLSLSFIGYEKTVEKDRLCEILMDFSIAAFGIGLLSIYVYLWIRQRALYLQPFISCLYTKPVKLLSWSLLFFLVTGDLLTVILYIAPVTYASSSNGCVNVQRDLKNLPHYLGVCLQVVGQVLLLALYLNPLIKHKQVQRSFRQSTYRTSLHKSGCASKNRVLLAVRRSFWCAFACVISAISSMLVASFVISIHVPRVVTNVVFDLSLTLTVLFIILSFESYKSILMSPLCCQLQVNTCAMPNVRSKDMETVDEHWIPPDLEDKVQHYKSGVGSLPS